MTTRAVAAGLVAATLLAGCRADDALNPRPVPAGGALFQTYVAMGNSITAGYQSGGINDSTQRRAYPALVAQQAGAQYGYASVFGGACSPLVNNVTGVRVETSAICARTNPTATFITNVGVPGARILEAISNVPGPPTFPPGTVSSSNALTQLILGGRTQVSAMMQLRPTLVTLWLGANDVLGSFTNSTNPGRPDFVTPVTTWQALYATVLDSIAVTGAKAVLIGVPDVTVIPFASRGAIYWCLKNGGCPPPLPPALPQVALNPLVTIANSCAPAPVPGGVGLNVVVPWTVGISGVLGATPTPANPNPRPFTLDCANDAQVVTAAELANLQGTVNQYNAFVRAQAQARGWAFVDASAILASYVANGMIPPFPDLSAVLANPANPGPITFGPLFTLDGVHPSTLAHRIVADSVISAINRTYGTSLALVGR